MRNRTIIIILTVLLLISISGKAGTGQKSSTLQIYLTREITIKSDIPRLGDVAIIRGDESLAAKVSEITLGRISVPGQKIFIDRSVVLSRLASSGVSESEVTLTGAEKITVSREHQLVKSDEVIEKALAFLKKNSPDASICQWNPTRKPQDLILSGINENLRYSLSLVSSGGARNHAKVRVAVFSDDKQIGVREVTFGFKYNCRKVVAKVEIQRGEAISAENVKVEKGISNTPVPANWRVPYGLVARRRLPANTVIVPNMVEPVKPVILLKRNQIIVIKIDRPGLLITAMGKTMQDGRVGEYIRVQNVDSKRMIIAKVNEDGSVEPVF